MNSIRIQNPYLFFIAIPLLALVIVGFFLIPKYKRFRIKNIISLGLHLVISVRLTLAFVDIQYAKSSTGTELIVLADCSKSEFLNSEHIDGLIKDVYKEAGSVAGTKIGVVAFAKNQEVVTKIGSNYKSGSILKYFEDNSSFDNSATDLKSALLYADSLYSDNSGVRRRIIRSDGLETDGSAIEALGQLTSDSVQVDAISRSQPEFDEVAITGLDYNDRAYVGKKQQLKVSVKSKKAGKLNVTLTSEGKIVSEFKDEVCNKGINVYSFDLASDEQGTFRYDVSLSGRADTFEENNKRSFTQEFTDHYNVLFVGTDQAELDNIKSSFPENVNITSYINRTDVPCTIKELINYDEIVLSNIDIQDLPDPTTFVASLKTAVEDYGKSLLTLGSVFPKTVTSGGTAIKVDSELRSDYNSLLPVQSESDGRKAIVLLIDNSGSMDTDSRIRRAKDGASAILKKLNDKDYISIITFSDEIQIVTPLTSVKNKDTIESQIKKIKSKGGTVMGPGLKAARKQLQNSPIENKFCITLSDGEPSDKNDLKKIVKDRVKDDITCSFININNSNGINLLKDLAKIGQGTYYFCRKADSLADIRLTAIVMDVNIKAVEDASAVKIQDPTDVSVEGVESFPSILGYSFVRIKKQANTILTLQYNHESVDENENESSARATVPLYAYWNVGKANGRVASFSSDFGTDWTEDFRTSEGGQLFRKQRLEDTLPTRNIDSMLDRSYVNHGVTSSVSFIAAEKNNNAKIHLKVTSPDKTTTKEYDLSYDGYTFSGDIETGTIGLYEVEITYSYEQKNEDGSFTTVTNDPVSRQLNFDYSSEFDRFPDTSSTLLYSLTKNSGKVSYDTVDYEVSNTELSHQSYQSLNFVFRIVAVVLLLIDIFVRKSDFQKKKKQKQDRNLRSGK